MSREGIVMTVAVAGAVGVVSAFATIALFRSWTMPPPHDPDKYRRGSTSRRSADRPAVSNLPTPASHRDFLPMVPRRTDPFDPRPREG